VCAWEKKGTLQVLATKDQPQVVVKRGGNIVTYICEPDGRVLHAILSAPPAAIYRGELEWSTTIAAALPRLVDAEPRVWCGRKHEAANEAEPNNWYAHAAHQFLSTRALEPVGAIEREVFTSLLGQTYAPEEPVKHVVVEQLPVEFG
jgi:hypothetical protein